MNDHLHAAVKGLLARAERLVARARAEVGDLHLDLALSAVYPARGAAELLREASKEGRIKYSVAELDALFEKHVPHWKLVWAVRIHDFHKAGLSPDPENPYGLLTTVPGHSTIVVQLNEEPPRIRLVEGSADAAGAIFMWAPPYVQIGADAKPIPILDAVEPYLDGMRSLVALIRSTA
jgi:hypothetical protein